MRLFRAELLKLRTTAANRRSVSIAAAARDRGHRRGREHHRVARRRAPSSDLPDILDVARVRERHRADPRRPRSMTWEFRHDTIAGTFLVEPRRECVIAAKTAAAIMTGALLAVIAVAAGAFGIASVWIGGDAGVSFDSSVWERALRQPAESALPSRARSASAWARSCAARRSRSCSPFDPVPDRRAPRHEASTTPVGRYLPGGRCSASSPAPEGTMPLAVGPAVVLSIAYTLAIVGAGRSSRCPSTTYLCGFAAG